MFCAASSLFPLTPAACQTPSDCVCLVRLGRGRPCEDAEVGSHGRSRIPHARELGQLHPLRCVLDEMVTTMTLVLTN
eukprot:765983-Hanusia_phi.AAC.2